MAKKKKVVKKKVKTKKTKAKEAALPLIEHVAEKGLPIKMIKAIARKVNEVIDRLNERSKT